MSTLPEGTFDFVDSMLDMHRNPMYVAALNLVSGEGEDEDEEQVVEDAGDYLLLPGSMVGIIEEKEVMQTMSMTTGIDGNSNTVLAKKTKRILPGKEILSRLGPMAGVFELRAATFREAVEYFFNALHDLVPDQAQISLQPSERQLYDKYMKPNMSYSPLAYTKSAFERAHRNISDGTIVHRVLGSNYFIHDSKAVGKRRVGRDPVTGELRKKETESRVARGAQAGDVSVKDDITTAHPQAL